jgi:hypothetical protein
MQKMLLAVLSLASLSLCLISAILHFLGHLSNESYKVIFLVASAGWFILAALWARKRKRA